MSHVNDVGGMHGFGPIRTDDDDAEPFDALWQAQCMMLTLALVEKKVITLDEFRHAVESLPPHEYLALPYHERHLTALESLFARKGLS